MEIYVTEIVIRLLCYHPRTYEAGRPGKLIPLDGTNYTSKNINQMVMWEVGSQIRKGGNKPYARSITIMLKIVILDL